METNLDFLQKLMIWIAKNLPLGNQAQLRKTTTTRSNIELMAFILTHDIWITTTNRNQLYCDCSWCAFSGYRFCCLYGHSAHIETACFHCEQFSCVCPVCACETEFCDISHIPLLLLHYMQPFHMSHVLESNFLALVDFTNAGEATTTLLTGTESSLTMLDTWLSVFSANIFGSNLFLDVFCCRDTSWWFWSWERSSWCQLWLHTWVDFPFCHLSFAWWLTNARERSQEILLLLLVINFCFRFEFLTFINIQKIF